MLKISYALRHMLATLYGTVTEIHEDFFILEINGLGYRLRAHTRTLSAAPAGQKLKVYVHEHIREDAYDLFAFLSMEEMVLFKKMLDVSGVGPKVALAVCGSADLEDLHRKLVQGDVDWLVSIPGLGKKTAQKIVLELKGRLVEVGAKSETDRETIAALTGLGYTAFQAREATKQIPDEIQDSGERVRTALKYLSK